MIREGSEWIGAGAVAIVLWCAIARGAVDLAHFLTGL